MKKIELHTDGACSGNPGPGGWGAILICSEPVAMKELSGGEEETTNNRMELSGVIEGLCALNERCDVQIYTDSKYVVDAFNKNWIGGWLKRDWKTASKSPVKNIDLWKKLLKVLEGQQATWNWVKGHAGHEMNERADDLAVEQRDKYSLIARS